MNRVEKYLDSINKQMVLIDHETYQHYGGKSFYNVGTFKVEVYQLIGTELQIRNKVTGRKEYSLYCGTNLLGMGFSQQDFIKNTLEKFVAVA